MRAGGARTYELEWGAGVSPACGDGGRKPSLSAWKPRRGLGVESWVRGRPRPHALKNNPRMDTDSRQPVCPSLIKFTYLRAFAPPREPVRCTRRRGERGGISQSSPTSRHRQLSQHPSALSSSRVPNQSRTPGAYNPGNPPEIGASDRVKRICQCTFMASGQRRPEWRGRLRR
jgi:hypothetical protein